MTTFETKLTVRIYDIKLAEKLNELYRCNPNRYQTKNQLIVELIELGLAEKLKTVLPPPSERGEVNTPTNGDTAKALKQIRCLLGSMHVNNQKQLEGLVAHLKMSERLLASIYNTLLAVATGEPITKVQVEFGFLDTIPERFEEYLNEMLKETFGENDSGGGKEKEYKS